MGEGGLGDHGGRVAIKERWRYTPLPLPLPLPPFLLFFPLVGTRPDYRSMDAALFFGEENSLGKSAAPLSSDATPWLKL